MSSFIKADLKQTNDYCASFNQVGFVLEVSCKLILCLQYLFDILSKLADKSTEQVTIVSNEHKNNQTILLQEKHCVLCVTAVSLILVFIETP